jgi:hypothetical protein
VAEERRAAGGRSGVSVFANASHLGLLVAMTGMAAISGVVLAKCVEEQDSSSAKLWGTVFGAASLVAAWSFGRLV